MRFFVYAKAYWRGFCEGAGAELRRQMPLNVFLCLCLCLLVYLAIRATP